eukprot:423625-Amphidinium_carterae.3
MRLHSDHGARMIKAEKQYYIHSVAIEGFIHKVQISRSQINAAFPRASFNGTCGSDLISHEEESDMQHSEDVAKSLNLFDPGNQPGHSAEGTHHLTSGKTTTKKTGAQRAQR